MRTLFSINNPKHIMNDQIQPFYQCALSMAVLFLIAIIFVINSYNLMVQTWSVGYYIGSRPIYY